MQARLRGVLSAGERPVSRAARCASRASSVQPRSRSLVLMRSTIASGRDSISALIRITYQPAASSKAIRSMSHDR